MDKNKVRIYFFGMKPVDRWFSSYLPLNDEARRWEIYCHDVGFTRVPPGSPYPPSPEEHPKEYAAKVTTGRTLEVFQLVYITDGTGWFWSERSGQADVSPGTVFILFPGVKHAYRPNPDTGWTEEWIGFGGPHAHRLWNNGILQAEQPIFNIGVHQDEVAIFDSAIALCREQTPGFQIRLGALVLQIVASVQAFHKYEQQHHTAGEIIRRARYLMQQQLESGISVEEIASRCSLSYGQLLRAFRQYTGLTPYQYFLQLRIHRAKELLENPNVQIKEVAARLQFENQYYFARLFKKKVGVSPSQWRGQVLRPPSFDTVANV
jgi:AraC-like DNA-binding protein